MLAERGPELDIEALGEMDVLQRNITEALRLFPPLIMLLRQAKAAFAVETSAGRRHVVPKVASLCQAQTLVRQALPDAKLGRTRSRTTCTLCACICASTSMGLAQ